MKFFREPAIFHGNDATKYVEITVKVLKLTYETFAEEITCYSQQKQYSTILDVGTGHGVVLAKLVERLKPKTAIGIDASWRILQLAKAMNRNTSNIYFQTHDIMHLGFKNGSFDLVISTLAFHHFPHPIALMEMLRILKDNGTLIIYDFDGHLHLASSISLLLKSKTSILSAIPLLGWGLHSIHESLDEQGFMELAAQHKEATCKVERHGIFLKVTFCKRP